MSLLKVSNLTVGFNSPDNYRYKVIKNISFELKKGEVLGIVGESGSGKSLTSLSIILFLYYLLVFHDYSSVFIFLHSFICLPPPFPPLLRHRRKKRDKSTI